MSLNYLSATLLTLLVAVPQLPICIGTQPVTISEFQDNLHDEIAFINLVFSSTLDTSEVQDDDSDVEHGHVKFRPDSVDTLPIELAGSLATGYRGASADDHVGIDISHGWREATIASDGLIHLKVASAVERATKVSTRGARDRTKSSATTQGEGMSPSSIITDTMHNSAIASAGSVHDAITNPGSNTGTTTSTAPVFAALPPAPPPYSPIVAPASPSILPLSTDKISPQQKEYREQKADDCILDVWSDWSGCGVVKGDGMKARFEVRTRKINQPQAKKVTVTDADIFKCNGQYDNVGTFNEHHKFQNEYSAVIFFDDAWKMNCESSTKDVDYYSTESGDSSYPVEGRWRSVQDGHSPCVVEALGIGAPCGDTAEERACKLLADEVRKVVEATKDAAHRPADKVARAFEAVTEGRTPSTW